MKKLLLLTLMFLSVFAQAKNITSEHAAKIKSRKLIVFFEELIEIKGRETLVKATNTQTDKNNRILRRVVENYWTFNDNILYLSKSEAQKLTKKNPSEYALLGFTPYTEYTKTTNTMGRRDDAIKYYTYTPVNEILQLTLKIGNLTLMNIPLHENYTTKSEAVFAVMQMQYILNKLITTENYKGSKVMKEHHGEILREKTLLINKNDISKDLTKEIIKENYPFKFKIASNAEIDSAIINRDNQFVVLRVTSVPGSRASVWMHDLSDTYNGCIVSHIKYKRDFSISGIQITTNGLVQKKHIKKYNKIAII